MIALGLLEAETLIRLIAYLIKKATAPSEPFVGPIMLSEENEKEPLLVPTWTLTATRNVVLLDRENGQIPEIIVSMV